MQMKMGKIVMFGSMLAVVSFLVGLFQSSLPMMLLNAVQLGFEFFIFFCYGLSGIIFLGLATIVFAVSAVFLNPFGVMFLLGTLWLLIIRKPRLTH